MAMLCFRQGTVYKKNEKKLSQSSLPFVFPHSDKVRQKITSCTCTPAEAPRQAIREAPVVLMGWVVSYKVKPYHWSIPHLLSSWQFLCEGFPIFLTHKPLLIFNGVPPPKEIKHLFYDFHPLFYHLVCRYEMGKSPCNPSPHLLLKLTLRLQFA